MPAVSSAFASTFHILPAPTRVLSLSAKADFIPRHPCPHRLCLCLDQERSRMPVARFHGAHALFPLPKGELCLNPSCIPRPPGPPPQRRLWPWVHWLPIQSSVSNLSMGLSLPILNSGPALGQRNSLCSPRRRFFPPKMLFISQDSSHGPAHATRVCLCSTPKSARRERWEFLPSSH